MKEGLYKTVLGPEHDYLRYAHASLLAVAFVESLLGDHLELQQPLDSNEKLKDDLGYPKKGAELSLLLVLPKS